MTRNAAQNAYDEIPYPSIPKPESHPGRLATLAALFGMTHAPVERCRVLELACSDGGNITPMAFALPGSEFGPELDLHLRFEVPGAYRLWAQFRLGDGAVVTAPFVVHAR